MGKVRRRLLYFVGASALAIGGVSMAAPAATASTAKPSDEHHATHHDDEAHHDDEHHETHHDDEHHTRTTTLFVSKQGSDNSTCGAPASPCLTIGQAVTNASSRNTIVVLPGTYAEMVTVDKQLELRGLGATIDATGKNNGILLQGPGASHSTVTGFTVMNAIGEGILATQVTRVVIQFNTVMHNDLGATVPNSYPECQAMGQVPGDCGEGLHLQATTHSKVVGNDVSNNAGGILVSDDISATHDNYIALNRVTDNKPDCGITIPAHNPNGGVYDNTITHNFVTGNGEGGVLIAVGVPGAAARNNRVIENYLEGNGFAGVTIHAHFPGSNLNGNTIDRNLINTNNVTGDDDAGVTQTTGILVFSGDPSVHIKDTSIRQNIIMNNHFGIWLSPGLVSTQGIGHNVFANVAVPIQQ
jgi:nitrous oxidase accessory protein NosD